MHKYSGRHRQNDGALSRRSFLLGGATVAGTAAIGGFAYSRIRTEDRLPVAYVYRGPATRPGCPEAVATLLENGPTRFSVTYCGPDEATAVTAASLADADLYAQPGGDTVAQAWPHLEATAGAVEDFVTGGGVYLGFCLGGYLATREFGFDLFDGVATRHAGTPGAEVTTLRPTTVEVDWRGRPTTMYFQDAPEFIPRSPVDYEVLGRYRTGSAAAVVARVGQGSIGLVGPHPEADATWYPDGLTNPSGIDPSLGYDLITTTWKARTMTAPTSETAR